MHCQLVVSVRFVCVLGAQFEFSSLAGEAERVHVHGVGRRRAGQAAAAVAELHAVHGRHHLRRRLDQRGAARGGQARAPEDLQVHRRLSLGSGGQEQEQHPRPRLGKHAGKRRAKITKMRTV